MRSHCDAFFSTNHVNNYIQSILKVNNQCPQREVLFFCNTVSGSKYQVATVGSAGNVWEKK